MQPPPANMLLALARGFRYQPGVVAVVPAGWVAVTGWVGWRAVMVGGQIGCWAVGVRVLGAGLCVASSCWLFVCPVRVLVYVSSCGQVLCWGRGAVCASGALFALVFVPSFFALVLFSCLRARVLMPFFAFAWLRSCVLCCG